jgi:transposase
MEKTSAADRFVGIDVSKSWVDVHVRPNGIAFRCDSDAQGLADLVQRLRPFDPRLIVLEASGGYESLPAVSLSDAGLPVAIVNPRQVRKFAEALGQLAKTDAIDARVIAHFAEAVQPPLRPMPDAMMTQLRALLALRRQLVIMLNAEKQRLAKAETTITQRSCKAMGCVRAQPPGSSPIAPSTN